jgi:Protein of unknown function (DUF2924)
VVVKPQTLDIGLIPTSETSAQAENPSLTDSAPDLNPATKKAIPWTAPSFAAMKGIIHEPSTKPTMKPESRDALLTAIAKARGWIDDIRLGRSLKPGARLVREWRGRTHTVTVTEDGFGYAGKNYPSLTKIAKKITGAHWSGPRFFGLPAACAESASDGGRDG